MDADLDGDHGIVGMAMLATGITLGLWPLLRSSHDKPWGLLFLLLFGMSVYQRPVIWLPYAALLLFCGAAVAFRLPPPGGVDDRSTPLRNVRRPSGRQPATRPTQF